MNQIPKFHLRFRYLGALLLLLALPLISVESAAMMSTQVLNIDSLDASTPGPTPQAPRSELIGLEAQISTQEAQIGDLERALARHEDEVDFMLRDIQWRVDSRLWIGAAVAAVLGFLGFHTYRKVDRGIRERISTTLEQELYSLDPTMLSIRIRRGRELDREYRRLELSGLKNLSWYSDFGKQCTFGITIVPIDDLADEDEFLRLLDAYHFEPSRAAFVLYAREHRVRQKVIDAYENLTLANNPTSVAGAVLIVGRGLET